MVRGLQSARELDLRSSPPKPHQSEANPNLTPTHPPLSPKKMPAQYRHAVHWHRRDLRITDNTALYHASRQAESVIPLYIVSPWKKNHLWTGPGRQQFLSGCLASLAKNLTTISGRLIFRRGHALEVLEKFLAETNADALYFNRDPDPFGKETEKKILTLCQQLGIACHHYKDVVLHEPQEVLKSDGAPYRVYTPYSKPWLALEKPKPLPKPKPLNTPPHTPSDPTPTLAIWELDLPGDLTLPTPGEKAARARLRTALNHTLPTYGDTRDIPSHKNGTSTLSQDLRYGTLSIRTLYHKTLQSENNASQSILTYRKELAWREFYIQLLHHFPEVLELEFNEKYRGLPWHEPDEKLHAWQNGLTGFPFVDAGMRQLLKTGTMHNRVRMVVSMFLTKDLHYDWRLGENHFMRHLIDGEIASNNGGWQWSAGTGADAAPYFRIQNPWTQSKRFDPAGSYIKHWIPELKNTPAKLLHQPPTSPLAPHYPLPILDHTTERNQTLAIFKHHLAQQQ